MKNDTENTKIQITYFFPREQKYIDMVDNLIKITGLSYHKFFVFNIYTFFNKRVMPKTRYSHIMITDSKKYHSFEMDLMSTYNSDRRITISVPAELHSQIMTMKENKKLSIGRTIDLLVINNLFNEKNESFTYQDRYSFINYFNVKK